MSDGTAQPERQPAALAPDYFRVDETAFGQHAAMGAGLAAHLRFYDANAREDGSWADLFGGDELIVMGTILGFDPASLHGAFDEQTTAGSPQARVKAVLALAATMDHWYRQLKVIEGEGARTLAAAIELLVRRQLATEMVWFGGAFVSATWRGELQGYSYGRLEPMWFEARETRGPRQEAGREDRLRQCFSALHEAIDRLKEIARRLGVASRTSQGHEPAAGLWIAFTHLFMTVQERINAFTGRHTDFYYREMLGMRPRAAEPDRVHIVCEAVPGAPGDVMVPRGTAFSAGLDGAGRPVEFIAESELAVTDLKVQALRTLKLERGTLMLDQTDGMECVRRIRVDEPGRAMPGSPAMWPLFGGELRGSVSAARDAAIGFAIASELLLLKEGRREIALKLKLRRMTDDGGLWGRIAAKGELVQWQVARAFPFLFRASLTTAEGWWEVSECYVSRGMEEGDDTLAIRLVLPPEAPPVTPCVQGVHGPGWKTSLPVLRLLTRTDAAIGAYSLLQDMALAEVQLDVAVLGARDLVVANQLGRLDPSMPFMPFGPLPQQGSYFVFGSAEAAAKPLTRVQLNVEWGGLPQDDRGFEAWYEGYDTRWANDVFRTRTTVLQEGQWRGGGPAQGQRLFGDAAGGRPADTTTVAVTPQDLRAYYKPQAAGDSDFVYAVGSRGGFFRLELREPRGGFGHAEYPRVLTRVVASNARRKRQDPMPNPPYTPVVERVTLDYEASATLKFRADGEDASALRCFHVHPLGIERIDARGGPCGVLPVWSEDGNLHIGLSGRSAEGILTLLFELRAEAARPDLRRKARLRWSYLAGDRWRPLDPARLLSDTTGGFLTSGIVTLDVPADADLDHSVMPTGLFWLRLSADRDHDTFAGLAGVRAHALSAVRSARSSLPTDYEPLPAGGVAGPSASIAGIAKVMQAGASFGMRPAETPQQLQVRTGERLKHKSRALLSWDFERLVLERFPSVFKVRCLPRSRLTGGGAGSLVVVLPALGSEEQVGWVTGPTLHAIELERIRAFLAQRCSPFAEVGVRNASYEGIQVRCAIRFQRGVHPGEGRRRVQRAIFDYLSPWSATGIGAHFNWLVRREDVEACLRRLDCVSTVAGLSLVHIAEDDFLRYSLADTARPQGAVQWDAIAQTGASEARAMRPWSVAIPARTHLIEVIDNDDAVAPRPAGLGELGVGASFIVGGAP